MVGCRARLRDFMFKIFGEKWDITQPWLMSLFLKGTSGVQSWLHLDPYIVYTKSKCNFLAIFNLFYWKRDWFIRESPWSVVAVLNCAKSALAASSKRNSYLRSTGNDAAQLLVGRTMQKCTSKQQQHLHVQNSSKQLLSFHHFSSGPRTIKAELSTKTKSILLVGFFQLLLSLHQNNNSFAFTAAVLVLKSSEKKAFIFFSAIVFFSTWVFMCD